MLKIDNKLIPFIFVIVVTICFLILAFYFNFASVETIFFKADDCKGETLLYEDNELTITPEIRRANRSSKFRKSLKTLSPLIKSPVIPGQTKTFNNLHIDNLLSVDGGFVGNDAVLNNLSVDNQLIVNGKSLNPDNYAPGNFIVTETSFIEDIIPNGSLLQLETDTVFTINLPICDRKGLTINIWNNTRTAKNIKCIKNIVSGSKKSKFVTLHPNRVLILQYTGDCWVQLQNINMSEETEYLSDEILSKIESIIDEKSRSIDKEIELLKHSLEVKFEETKENFMRDFEKKFLQLKEVCDHNDVNDHEDISKLEKLIKSECDLRSNIVNVSEIVDKLQKEKRRLKLLLDTSVSIFDFIKELEVVFANIIMKIEGTSIGDDFVIFIQKLRVLLDNHSDKENEIMLLFDHLIETIRDKNITIIDKFSYILKKLNNQNTLIDKIVEKKKQEIISELFIFIKQHQAGIKENIESKIKDLYTRISTDIHQEIVTVVHNLEEKITNGNAANIETLIKQIKTNIENVKNGVKVQIQDKINDLNDKVNTQIQDLKGKFSELQSNFKTQISIAVADIQQQVFSNLEQYMNNIKTNLNVQLESVKTKMSSDIDTAKQELKTYASQMDGQLKNELKNELETQVDSTRNEFNSQIDELEGKLQTQLISIQTKITQMKTELPSQIESTINAQIKALQAQLSAELKQDLENIQTKISQMKQQLETSIGADVDQIKTQLAVYEAQINSQINTLNSQIQSLNSEYETLQTNITSGTVSFNAISTKYINNYILEMNKNGTNADFTPLLYFDNNSNQFITNTYLTTPTTNTSNNTTVGVGSFSNVKTSVGYNTGIGTNALRDTIGEYNTVLGAFNSEFVGSYNSYLGCGAGFGAGNTKSQIPGNANYNTFIGYMAGNMSGSSYNTLLGAFTSIGLNGSNSPFQYSTAIGLGAQITASNQIVIGGIYNGLITEYPEVFIPGQLSVNGSVSAGTVAANQITMPVGNAGYKVVVNSSNQYTYEPLVTTTGMTVPNDTFWIINPGYQVVCYSDTNFQNEVANINNTGSTTQMLVNSNDTIGTTSSVQSYQVCYSKTYQEIGTLVNVFAN